MASETGIPLSELGDGEYYIHCRLIFTVNFPSKLPVLHCGKLIHGSFLSALYFASFVNIIQLCAWYCILPSEGNCKSCSVKS